MTEHETKTIPLTRPVSLEPSANGEMLNRVQQLRLTDSVAGSKSARGGGASWLPWVLALFLAITWAAIGIKEYRNPGNLRQAFSKPGTNPNETANATSTTNSASGSSSPAAAPGTVVVGRSQRQAERCRGDRRQSSRFAGALQLDC